MHRGLMAVRRNSIQRLLEGVFGIAKLRDGQQRVIDSVLDGKDTLAIMPTGGGKSLCYQIPAKMLEGITVVVSPLISLMKDQLEKLEEIGVRAVQVNSCLNAEEEHAAIAAIEQETCEIVFCTPERMVSPEYIATLQKVTLDIVPDEDDPYAILAAFDPYGEELAKVRVAPTFKLSVTSATTWIDNGYRKPQ